MSSPSEIGLGLSLIVGGTFLPNILQSLNIVPKKYVRKFGDDNNNDNGKLVTKEQFALFHTFKYATSSLMVASGAAVVGHVMGFDKFLGSLSPPVSLMLTAIPLCGTTYMLLRTPREEGERKKALFAMFNLLNGLSFSCVYGFLPSQLVLKAGVYTASLFTGVSVGAVFSSFSSSSLRLPTLLGLSFLTVVSFAENIWSSNKTLRELNLYVGLVIVFATCMYDMKKLQEKANEADDVNQLDYINESIDFFLNFLNIFVRILRILIEQEIEKKKKESEEENQKKNNRRHQQ
eukprot:c9734_g1_i1.p1 GENE.c9734_g1_i1~~c9734_g1_i1.p1  ORF type:complete len:290 (+),score=-6.56 c9734_g1_i1:41-910(+)